MRLLPLLILCTCAFLAGCNASPPPPERQSEEAKAARDNSDLTQAIQTPIDKAKAVEDVQEAHDAEQRDAIDEQEEGN